MKKVTSLFTLLVSAFITTTAFASIDTVQTVANWHAVAVKKPQSEIGVTPLNSLHFEFTEQKEKFASHNGAFDISIRDIEGATDFKLTSKIISNELKNAEDNSVLTVKTQWNNKQLSANKETTIIDKQKGITQGLVATNSDKDDAKTELKNLQSAFLFDVINNDSSTQLKSLPNGAWEGTLSIEFTSKWSGDFVTLASR